MSRRKTRQELLANHIMLCHVIYPADHHGFVFLPLLSVRPTANYVMRRSRRRLNLY
jgi:hypothetical protein